MSTAKKNKKRGKRKQGDGEGFAVEETIEVGATAEPDQMQELREQLAQAKSEKNHNLANQLRQQIWIMQDLASGYKPKLGTDDVESQELLAKVVNSPGALSGGASMSSRPAEETTTSGLSAEERKLKSLKKKLKQIQALKTKQEQGVLLETNQIAKIEAEEAIKEDIEHLGMLLSVSIKR